MSEQTINDGGPASDKTLRDEFALSVIQPAMAGAVGVGAMSHAQRAEQFRTLGEIAYELADAMLTARQKASAD